MRGKRILKRYNPFDLSLIQVWKDGQPYEDAKPAELRNQRHSKIPADAVEEKPSIVSNYFERLQQEQEEKRERLLGPQAL
ncbi:hypothetical protein AB7942_30265 [Neobacillus sp. BF23-41]|uniref:hypothetical protein n=1 Tax=Neobacillus sp. BF23-41 TaxID=3240280 RepID=UPI0034E4B370